MSAYFVLYFSEESRERYEFTVEVIETSSKQLQKENKNCNYPIMYL